LSPCYAAFASGVRAESGIQVKMAELNLVDEVYQLRLILK